MIFSRCRYILPVLLAVVLLSACSSTRDSAADWHDIRNYPQVEAIEANEGVASYYHNKFHGRLTANGERYDKRELTAAHRDYPFGTYVRVTSMENGNSVIVRVNDRGPHIRSRIIDLSRAAAEELDMIHDGLVQVRVEVLAWGES
ncbi:MAG: septal ring lytic transglycosylase RlpA family protein [Bacteroidetes bacterium]|nr:septal ring lytic transglycosylase RlpA family protein [Bacteroidota bacterium]